jgi:hypothetical protein
MKMNGINVFLNELIQCSNCNKGNSCLKKARYGQSMFNCNLFII